MANVTDIVDNNKKRGNELNSNSLFKSAQHDKMKIVISENVDTLLNNSSSILSTFADNQSNTVDNQDHFIKCIFFCKFHAIAGPQIAAQVPNNYIPKDIFDTISQYVIPKAQLQRSFVSV